MNKHERDLLLERVAEDRKARPAQYQPIPPAFPDHRDEQCGSGWTGDRCTKPLFHEGDHSNDDWTDHTRDEKGNRI